MASNGYPVQHISQVADSKIGANNGVKHGNKIFTVDEALPYSPLSSVVPFDTGVIPLPTVGLNSSPSLFSTPEERDITRKQLDILNKEAVGPRQTSQRLEQTLQDLQRLLKSDSLTEYKFRSSSTSSISASTDDRVPKKLHLSPFAQMVYNHTDVAYRPLTPETPENRPVAGDVRKRPQKQRSPTTVKASPKWRVKSSPRIKQSESPQMQNAQSYFTNSTIEVVIPQGVAPSATLLKPEPRLVTPPRLSPGRSETDEPVGGIVGVVLPLASDVIQKNEYAVLPDSPTEANLSKKRRRSDSINDELANQGSDQRQKADTALRNFQEYLQSLFEAEEQLQSDPTSGPDTFIFPGEDELPSFSTSVHAKILPLLQNTISLGRFSQVSLDNLIRLRKLSEGSIKAAESSDLRIEDSWESADVDAWVERLASAETGLRSARTVLRLMTGAREEKQIYSEKIIQASLDAINHVMDASIIPIVELRSFGSSSDLFKMLSSQKKPISNALVQCQRLLSVLKDLVARIELSETVINTLEFMVSRLIFVENAPTEKESVLGVKKFDNLRVVAMDTLAQIFSRHPAQRQGIFNEILTSLEKLPVGKQSARQFKLPEGGSIQLVSALIMRLVQTSANKSGNVKEKRKTNAVDDINDDEDAEADDLPDDTINGTVTNQTIPAANDTEKRAIQQPVTAIQELQEVVNPLMDVTRSNANYVVTFIVNRAMRSTKSGDQPYRVLLDLFVQDFVTCLSSPDWPAAELLLRQFLIKMIGLADNDKTPAPAKTMALDLLGEMGAAISQLSSHVRKIATSLENTGAEEELGHHLARLADEFFEDKLRSEDLIAWTGPYRTSLEYLEENTSTDNPLESAIGYLLADWASQVCLTYDLISDEDPDHLETEREYGRLAYRLRMMIGDRKWLEAEYSFKSVVTSHARLAYALTLLKSQFCKAFDRVLMLLLTSTSSEQATVRSKSLKSVNQVLETDPTILDRSKNVMKLIVRCSNDLSVQVRDSALLLIGKCIGLRPGLEAEMIPAILHRVNDSGVGVRKRAIKLLRDIYLRSKDKDVKSAIADALLHRVTDLDEGVRELSRQTIEEVWMAPLYLSTTSEDITAQQSLSMADQVALMVQTVQRSTGVGAVLDKVLQSMLSNDSKNMAANFKVCKHLVATMFDTIIGDSNDGGPEIVEPREALQLLMTFAKANAKLFTTDQIQLLQPYITNLKTENDLAIFRSVVVIFRHVFPQLSTLHSNFLVAVRTTLMPSVSRVNRALVDDIFACLWIISGVLESTEHLARLASSSLDNIQKFSRVNLSDPSRADLIKKLVKLLMITGMCGKHCDLDSQDAIFKKLFPNWKGRSVSRLMVDNFAPFANPNQPLEVRKAALDALGLVCQSWPKNFSSANVYAAFLQAFRERNTELESVILRSFKDFFVAEEKRSDPDAEASVGVTTEAVATLGVMGGSQNDGVGSDIDQKFKEYITRIALATQDDHALLATEILVSINKQGLNHPKHYGPTFVALETSQNQVIADLAFRQHRSLHEKHETIMEKELMRSVQAAYEYQRDTVKDTHGATTSPYTAKLYLLIEVFKISKVKARKRFYENLCDRIDFEPSKLNARQNMPPEVDYARFIIENMTFFEYITMDELFSTIAAMEKVVASTGTIIAHAIETEIFKIGVDQAPQAIAEGDVPPPVAMPNDMARLRQLAAGSMILSSLWEARSYIRKLYGLSGSRGESKGKSTVKDLNRAPTKYPGVSGDKFWEEINKIMSSLSSPESMMGQCRSFLELLTVDKDFKVAAEVDDESAAAARLNTPSDEDGDEQSGPPGGSGRGRKRKGSGTPGGRKKRARSSSRGRNKKGRRGSFESGDDDDDWN